MRCEFQDLQLPVELQVLEKYGIYSFSKYSRFNITNIGLADAFLNFSYLVIFMTSVLFLELDNSSNGSLRIIFYSIFIIKTPPDVINNFKFL